MQYSDGQIVDLRYHGTALTNKQIGDICEHGPSKSSDFSGSSSEVANRPSSQRTATKWIQSPSSNKK